jgi:hypothetical protein
VDLLIRTKDTISRDLEDHKEDPTEDLMEDPKEVFKEDSTRVQEE